VDFGVFVLNATEYGDAGILSVGGGVNCVADTGLLGNDGVSKTNVLQSCRVALAGLACVNRAV
jgi:uncharacterized protein GlcG (DUF336 family)